MKAYYKGFIIEKDQTIETELYYIRRADGGKWSLSVLDFPVVSIESIQGTIKDVKKYIDSIEDYFEA